MWTYYIKVSYCSTAIPYRASTGPEQGIPCVVFPHRENPVFIAGFPVDENRVFPVGNTKQGKPCFHYRDGFAVSSLNHYFFIYPWYQEFMKLFQYYLFFWKYFRLKWPGYYYFDILLDSCEMVTIQLLLDLWSGTQPTVLHLLLHECQIDGPQVKSTKSDK